MRHYVHRRAAVPMVSKATGKIEFEVLVYGRGPDELLTVPNDVISALARRYPDHQSSPFAVRSPPPINVDRTPRARYGAVLPRGMG